MAEQTDTTQDSEVILASTETAEQTAAAPEPPEQPSEQAAQAEGESATDSGTENDVQSGQTIEYGQFELPEGFELDEETDSQFREIAAKAGLPQETAQELVNLAMSLQAKAAETLPEQINSEIEQRQQRQSSEWVAQIKSMEGIGGAQFEQSKQHALAAVKEFCPPELREQLSDPAVGNNPAVFAMLAKIGQRISQDSFVTGKPAPTGEKRAADILYNQS